MNVGYRKFSRYSKNHHRPLMKSPSESLVWLLKDAYGSIS